ncbi:MAG: hypothetical protein Q9164_000196 [Protoblastenia rupestris]
MVLKGGVKKEPITAHQKRRVTIPQDTGKKPISDQVPQQTQRITRSQAKPQQAQSTSKAIVRGRSPSPSSNNHIYTSLQREPLAIDVDTEHPASQQTQPLPLTRDSLQLLNDTNRTLEEPSMVSTSEQSEVSNASLNAYDQAFEPALNDRYVFFFKGNPGELPDGLDKLRKTVFAKTYAAKPPRGQACRVRRLLSKVKGEPDMVSRVMPEIVPLEELEKEGTAEIAVNQVWRRCLALDPDIKPSLATPKPNMTIGWTSNIFPFQKASKNLRSFQFPVPSNNDLSWPLFIVEIEGEGGCLRHAQLQNLHNAAIMLSNLRELMKAALKEADFFNKIHVLSLELTVETVQLSYYWATRSKKGQVVYYGKTLENWAIRSERDASFNEAYRCVHNAIELVRTQAYPSVYSYMDNLEQIFDAKPMTQTPSPRSISNQKIRKLSCANTSS